MGCQQVSFVTVYSNSGSLPLSVSLSLCLSVNETWCMYMYLVSFRVFGESALQLLFQKVLICILLAEECLFRHMDQEKLALILYFLWINFSEFCWWSFSKLDI